MKEAVSVVGKCANDSCKWHDQHGLRLGWGVLAAKTHPLHTLQTDDPLGLSIYHMPADVERRMKNIMYATEKYIITAPILYLTFGDPAKQRSLQVRMD